METVIARYRCQKVLRQLPCGADIAFCRANCSVGIMCGVGARIGCPIIYGLDLFAMAKEKKINKKKCKKKVKTDLLAFFTRRVTVEANEFSFLLQST